MHGLFWYDHIRQPEADRAPPKARNPRQAKTGIDIESSKWLHREVISIHSASNIKRKKGPELLAPAGDLERLIAAIAYGADAVYLGGAGLDLRAYAPGFSMDDLKEGIARAREAGVRIYLTFNIIAHNRHLAEAEAKLKEIEKLEPDALIIADPGLLDLVRQTAPQLPVHLSTQAAVTNWRSARFWAERGVKRINLSRELTLEEIQEIGGKLDIELEAFVHGAMCVAYSGRCLLSAYFTGRGANRGECTHPCRWRYELYEETRPDNPLLLTEGEEGSVILSSKDLCMIGHIPEMVQSGVSGLKIEGRMKGTHYVATVTKVYRQALDRYLSDPQNYTFDPSWEKELQKISHRPYHTGFYFGKPEQVDPYAQQNYLKECVMAGVVLQYEKDTGTAVIEQRNRFEKGDTLEVFGPGKEPFRFEVKEMYDKDGMEIPAAPHPRQIVRIPVEQELSYLDILRKFG